MTYMYGREIGEFYETLDSYRLVDVFWGPEATEDNRQEALEKILKTKIDTLAKLTLGREGLMKDQVKQTYELVSESIKNCQFDLSDPEQFEMSFSDHPLRQRIHNIFGNLDQALLLLGNWVRN